MWICTVYGFYSVSAAKLDPERPALGLDPDTLMIRGRSVKHLENLQERFPDLLGEYEIATSAGTDYYCRLVVPAKVWLAVQMGLTEEIEYGNFKNEVAARHLTEPSYKAALSETWSTFYRLQTSLRSGGDADQDAEPVDSWLDDEAVPPLS